MKLGEAAKSLEAENWKEALATSNMAVRLAPSPSSTLADALYLRARVLLGSGEPGLALRDATLAGIKGSWPETELYRLYQLQAHCQVALGEASEALKCLHRALSALDRSQLGGEESFRERTLIQEQLAIVGKKKEQTRKRRDTRKEETAKVASTHRRFPSLSSCIEVRHNEKQGRHVVARRPVQHGEVLGVEEPVVHCLAASHLDKRCSNCLTPVNAPLPCASCTQVVFCSLSCRQEASTSFHQVNVNPISFVNLDVMNVSSLFSHISR